MERSIFDTIVAPESNKGQESFRVLRSTGQAFEIERQLRRRDNTLIWASLHFSAIQDDKGQPRSIIIVMLDITQRKSLEQQKDEFLGIASHELKTPVTSIQSYAEILQKLLEDTENPKTRSIIGKLNQQVERMTELIHLLLDTTKISKGNVELKGQQLDINALIREVLDSLSMVTSKHPVQLELQPVTMIYADRDRIGQVLSNLISNAVKYSPEGSKIVVSTKDTGNSVEVGVSDFGIGISPEKKSRIFDRFYRVINTGAQNLPGFGLGLYIAAEIVKKHGGEIDVQSHPGEGSEFVFRLPYDFRIRPL